MSIKPDDAAVDAALIARWKRGDQAAATELVARHAPSLARFAASSGEREQIDELVQDTLVRAFNSLDSFRSDSSLRTWLFTILRNAFYEQQRRRKREAVAIEGSFDLSEAAEPAQEARGEINDLQQVIWRLPPLLREALILVGAQELSHQEAAAVCNVPVGTMKARLSRVRVALATAMRDAEAPG